MAIKRLILLIALLTCAASSFAQTTSVSATAITDAGGAAWKNGTFNFQFVPSPVNPFGPYFQGGVPFNTSQVIAGSLDNTGSFTQAVPDNKTISPAGSGWKFTVCPAATAPCSTFTFTITGASQVLSVTPPAIIVSMSSPPNGAAAYTDGEIFGARQGQFYFNLTDNTLHMCSLPVCTWLSLASPTSILPLNNTFSGQNAFTNNNTHSGLESFSGGFSGLAGGHTAFLFGINDANYDEVYSRLRAIRPAPDAAQYPLGHDLAGEADGSADARLVNGAVQVTSSTSLTGGGGAQVITVATPVLVSAPFGSTSLPGNATASFCNSAIDPSCLVIVDPDAANEETIAYTISSGNTLTVTPANSHTQPFTVKQIGATDIDARTLGINRSDVSDRPLSLKDRSGNIIVNLPNDTAGTWPKRGMAFNATLTGANGANKDLPVRSATASSCLKYTNFAGTAVFMQLCETSGGAVQTFSNPTNSPFTLDVSGTDSPRFKCTGTSAGCIWYTNIGGGTSGIFSVRNNPTNDVPNFTVDTSTGNVAARGGISAGAITNSTALQLLNSSTTCTTGASIGATCTTGAITLPVVYSDTNYRLSCTGLGPTNVPIVQTYTKSNATFTITVAALTAAAASFTSYDCIAGHN